ISVAVSINLVLYGCCGPFAAAFMNRFGIRRVVIFALLVIAAGVGLTPLMRTPWELYLLWGLVVGMGTGALATVLATTFADRSTDFWLLVASFFICGATTNGLIQTHLIPAAADHGIPEVAAASMLALVGVFDVIGTAASGWLTDRIDSRWLLFWYYGLRGVSL